MNLRGAKAASSAVESLVTSAEKGDGMIESVAGAIKDVSTKLKAIPSEDIAAVLHAKGGMAFFSAEAQHISKPFVPGRGNNNEIKH